jgi:hypothetical protein
MESGDPEVDGDNEGWQKSPDDEQRINESDAPEGGWMG